MIDKSNLKSVLSRIVSAKERSDHSSTVEVVAVTKNHSASVITSSYNLGLRHIGENKVQEGEKKIREIKTQNHTGLTKRFIGHLQSNKVNKCLDVFDTVDSVHSFKLAKKISNRAGVIEKKIPVLLEIKTSEEDTKHGFGPQETNEILLCTELPNIQVQGLMTMAPFTQDQEKIRKSFRTLRLLLENLNNQKPELKMRHLSMGMSSDFEIAIEEGSTMVRLGTILFGKRNL
tara:strand:- start:217 stop:909 length:693 start_codon:yes stop_codon:yes gene_type:complete